MSSAWRRASPISIPRLTSRRRGSTRSRAASPATRNVEGIDELKDAIIAKFQRDNALSYERSQILVSTGAKQTIYNLCMAVLDPGR